MAAARGVAAGLVAVVVAVFCAGASAQSGCTAVIISLAPCLSYITGNSTSPSSTCCTQLASIVGSQPQCLCTVLNGAGGSTPLGISVNQTQALALPGACKVQTPPVSQCDAAAAGPATPPTPATPSTPAAGSIPSGNNGSKATPATPATGGQSSDGSANKLTISLFCFLFVASAGFF